MSAVTPSSSSSSDGSSNNNSISTTSTNTVITSNTSETSNSSSTIRLGVHSTSVVNAPDALLTNINDDIEMEELVAAATASLDTILSLSSINYVSVKGSDYASYDVLAILLYLWFKIEIAEDTRQLSNIISYYYYFYFYYYYYYHYHYHYHYYSINDI